MCEKIVCHITTAHESTDIRIFQKECTSLAKEKDFKVFLLAKGESRKENNVSVIGLGSTSGRLQRMFTFSKKVYKAALELDADIYHFHDPEFLPYALKLKKRGKIVVFDSHEDTTEQILIKTYIPKFLRKIISKTYYLFESYVCKRIDAVIFPCPIDGKHPFQDRAKECIYLNNVPQDPIKIDEIDENPQKTCYNKICYVGSLSEQRGVTSLLKAYKLMNEKITLVLAGKFETKEYEKYLRECGLLDDVDYRGYCNSKEIADIYNECAIGLSTLLNIGQYPKLGTFPTKVFEYMSYRLPVIVSEYPYSKKLVEEYNFGICIDPENPDEIAEAVNYLSENVDISKEMGCNGRNLVDLKFNWNIEFKNIIQLYRKILLDD